MKIILSLAALLLTLSTFGRAPAVEPIRGISIEDYKEVDPKKDPGFNWNRNDFVRDTSLITTRTPAQNALINQTTNQKTTWPTYLFLAGLITLPFLLWYSVMKGLAESEKRAFSQSSDTSSTLPHHNNTVDLSAERNKRESTKTEKEDIHKAS